MSQPLLSPTSYKRKEEFCLEAALRYAFASKLDVKPVLPPLSRSDSQGFPRQSPILDSDTVSDSGMSSVMSDSLDSPYLRGGSNQNTDSQWTGSNDPLYAYVHKDSYDVPLSLVLGK
jgi:hypothetical protein